MEGSFANESKGVEGCVISGKLVSVAIERSQTFCSAVHRQSLVLLRERAARKWTLSGCLFPGCDFIGMTSIEMTYTWSFAKNGCMLTKLSLQQNGFCLLVTRGQPCLHFVGV